MYWLFFNLALFHCTITAATHKYRPTFVHDVSITQPFSASNCAVFSSSVYICYMWDWVMWPVYWLCWIETWQMWIYRSWTLCGLLKWNLLGNCSAQRERNCKKLYLLAQWQMAIPWLYQRMNTLYKELPRPMMQPHHHCDLESLISILSKWTIQCVHVDNVQLNCDSTGLHSHNWIEAIELDIWMQKIIQCTVHRLHCLKAVYINVLYILCIRHLTDVPERTKQCVASNNM